MFPAITETPTPDRVLPSPGTSMPDRSLTIPPPRRGRRSRDRYDAAIAGRVIVVVVVAGISIAMGVLLVQGHPTSAGLALAAAPALVAFWFFVLQGPRLFLAGLIATTIFGFGQYSVAAGGVDVRLPDVFLVVLAGWAVVLRVKEGRRGFLVGRRALAVWLVAIGFSMYPVYVWSVLPQDSLISWARIVATFSLVWLVPYALRTLEDLEFTLGAIALAATIEVGVLAMASLARGDVSTRLEGPYGPNGLGLVAAIAVILAIHGPVPRQRSLRYTVLVIGAVGLLMTRSLSATAAAVLVLGVYGLRAVYSRTATSRHALIAPWRVLLMLALGLAVAVILRPSNLPWSSDFGHSTTVHRLILGDAGLHIFGRDPVTGVGWQRMHDAIGAPGLNAELRAEWGPDVNQEFFPERGGPSVHNAYIEVLAESGLVGFVALVVAMIALGVGVARVMRATRSHRAVYVSMRATLVLLIVVLIWLNDNPLLGAQVETVLAATFLGIFASAGAVLRSADRPAGAVLRSADRPAGAVLRSADQPATSSDAISWRSE